MKQVNFKKILIQNFLSVGDPITIPFTQGLNVITGENLDLPNQKNGVGKSTIADAFHFSVFGETARDINKNEVVNDIRNKDCKTLLEFDIIENGVTKDYVISRGIEPTQCRLFGIRGTEKLTKSTMPKTNQYIKELISSTPEVFQNSVIMSSNDTLPFMAQGKVAKRKFIEGILDLGVFSEMLLLARQEQNDLKKDLEVARAKYNEILPIHNDYIARQKDKQENRDAKLEELQARVLENMRDMEQCNSQIVPISKDEITELKITIEHDNKEISILNEEHKALWIDIATNSSQMGDLNKRIVHLVDHTIGTTCPECDREFDENDEYEAQKQMESLKKALETAREVSEGLAENDANINTAIDEYKEKVSKNTKRIQEIKLHVQQNKNIATQLAQHKKSLDQIKKDIANLESVEDEYVALIKESAAKLKISYDEIEALKIEIEILEATKWIASEEGVKSFIVKKLLKVLNSKLAHYLQRLEAPCTFSFNEYFEEIILNKRGKTKSYFSFSNGQRKRIDLACLFTFIDIRRLQGNVGLNVLFFDELLDTSLDKRGIECALSILKERAEKYNECIYIISHKPEAIEAATGDLIHLVLKNGFTKLSNLKEIHATTI